jgi:5-methylcytosine-specific restriction endonuclease McrA
MTRRNTQKATVTSKRKPISRKDRFEIFNRDGFKCTYCGQSSPDVVLHVDHIKPVAKGGTNDRSNLTTACSACNSGKSDSVIGDVKTEDSNREEAIKKKKLSILDRDNHKCVMCSDDESELFVTPIADMNTDDMLDHDDGHFMTVCNMCLETIYSMRQNLNMIIPEIILNRSYRGVGLFDYICDFANAINMDDGDYNDPHLVNIFTAIELYISHNNECAEIQYRYEKANEGK